jgi:predicted transcriptional regulator
MFEKPIIISMGIHVYHVGAYFMKARTERSRPINAEACERWKNRGRQDIIMDILRTAKQGNTKTRLIDKANLSSAQCNKYLENLKNADYISEENGIWKTTNRGLQVIDACVICHSLMDKT